MLAGQFVLEEGTNFLLVDMSPDNCGEKWSLSRRALCQLSTISTITPAESALAVTFPHVIDVEQILIMTTKGGVPRVSCHKILSHRPYNWKFNCRDLLVRYHKLNEICNGAQ